MGEGEQQQLADNRSTGSRGQRPTPTPTGSSGGNDAEGHRLEVQNTFVASASIREQQFIDF